MSQEKKDQISLKAKLNMSNREIMCHQDFPKYRRVRIEDISQYLANGWKFGKTLETSKNYIQSKMQRCKRENIPLPNYLVNFFA